MRYLSEDQRKALLMAAHGIIHETTTVALTRIEGSTSEAFTRYPPDKFGIAIPARPLELGEEQRRFVESILKTALSDAFFSLFCLLDGVADPPGFLEHWPGFNLSEHDEDHEEEFLHDDFLPAYWDWLEAQQSQT